jgi:hypothetical protein
MNSPYTYYTCSTIKMDMYLNIPFSTENVFFFADISKEELLSNIKGI